MSQSVLPIRDRSDSLVRQVSRVYVDRFVSRYVFLAGRHFLAVSILSHLFFRISPKMSPSSTTWMPALVNPKMSLPPTACMPVLVKDLCNPDVVATIAKKR